MDVPESAQAIVPQSSPPPHQIQPPSEQLPELYIDSNSRVCLGSLYSIIILTSAIFLFASIGIPSAQVNFKPNDIICSNPVIIGSDSSIQCLPFDVYNNPNFATYVPSLNKYHQYIKVYMLFYLENTNYGIDVEESIYVSFTSVTNNNGTYYADKQLGVVQAQFDVDVESLQFKQNGQFKGYYQKLFYRLEIPSPNILFMSSIPSLIESVNIKNVTLQIVTANPQSTRFMYSIRIAFFCISLLTFASFSIRISLMHRSRKVIQQRFVMVLGGALLFFNDPFFFLTITKTTGSKIFFSSYFYLIFPVILLFFFMCVFERADTENNQKESYVLKNSLKWIMIVITLAFLSGFYLYTAYNHQIAYSGNQNPINTTTYKALKGFSLVFVVICYAFAFHHFVHTLINYEAKLQRYRTIINVSSVYFFFSFFAFITSSFYIFDNWPWMTFMQFTLFNTYVFILQVLYSPTKAEIRRKYPSKLTNAEIAQRAADHINQNYVPNILKKQGFQKYNQMNDDQLRTEDMRVRAHSHSLVEGSNSEEFAKQQYNNSMQQRKSNYERYERPLQKQYLHEDNYKIQPRQNHSHDHNEEHFEIGDDVEKAEQEKVDEENYFYREDNEHEKHVQSEQEDQEEQENHQNLGEVKQSKLLSLSQSGILPVDNNFYLDRPVNVTESQIISRNNEIDVRQNSVSNILDDVYQGDLEEQSKGQYEQRYWEQENESKKQQQQN